MDSMIDNLRGLKKDALLLKGIENASRLVNDFMFGSIVDFFRKVPEGYIKEIGFDENTGNLRMKSNSQSDAPEDFKEVRREGAERTFTTFSGCNLKAKLYHTIVTGYTSYRYAKKLSVRRQNFEAISKVEKGAPVPFSMRYGINPSEVYRELQKVPYSGEYTVNRSKVSGRNLLIAIAAATKPEEVISLLVAIGYKLEIERLTRALVEILVERDLKVQLAEVKDSEPQSPVILNIEELISSIVGEPV